MPSLRVVTWNVRGLRDDGTAVAETLRRLAADVVCLQESPRTPRWRSRTAALARGSALLYACGGRPSGGTVLLTAPRVDVRRTHELGYARTPGLEQRGAALALVRLAGGAELGVASVHLGLDAAERARHRAELEDALHQLGAPSVVAGDLNERPDGPVWGAIAARRVDAGAGDLRTTFPRRADWRIDGVFAEPPLQVRTYDVVDDARARAGSDHLPVLVDLEVPAA